MTEGLEVVKGNVTDLSSNLNGVSNQVKTNTNDVEVAQGHIKVLKDDIGSLKDDIGGLQKVNHQDIMTKTQSFQMSIDELKIGFSDISDQKLEKSIYEKTT